MRISDWSSDVCSSDLLALKGNQTSLHEDVELFVAEQKTNGFRDTTISRHRTVDGDHGRIETRTTTVIEDLDWLQRRHRWSGLKTVVMLESTREIGVKIEHETRLYISSLALQAERFGALRPPHWALAKHPHCVMDRTEDGRA